MKHTTHASMRSEKGFTLVELAVVMVIIGLLIGGILKGQEMIANAQVAATVAQVKGVDAATSTFRDMYDALPGDISNATVRINDCVAPCVNGNGSSTIGGVPGTLAGENGVFWIHLNLADLLSGVDGTATQVYGQGLPVAKAGGGLQVGYAANGVFGGLTAAGRGGHWIYLNGTPGVAAAAALTASETARIDRKMDDGTPASGSVISTGGACIAGAVYNEANDQVACSLGIRIQG